MADKKVLVKYINISFLSDVDESILNLKLDFDYKIEKYSYNDLFSYLPQMNESFFKHDLMDQGCLYNDKIKEKQFSVNYNECSIFVVKKEIEKEVTLDARGYTPMNIPPTEEQMYLRTVIQLLRLFKEGCIDNPFSLELYELNGIRKLRSTMKYGQPLRSLHKIYSLTQEDVRAFHIFYKKFETIIKNGEKLFQNSEEFINLAHLSFEESYRYQLFGLDLSFVLLMFALESLFSTDSIEITDKISRRVAVLFSDNENDFWSTKSNIKKLYGMRSEIVHGKRRNVIKEESFLDLRKYVRVSINRINDFKKTKKELADYLDAAGYHLVQL